MITAERCWQALDGGYTFLIVTSLILVVFFHALLPLYPTRKQRAWVLTAVGSALFTLSSIPFVAHVIIHHGDVSNLYRIPWWSDTACRIFQAYLLSDLVVGSFYYAEQINIITGWAHHIGYLILVDFTVSRGWSHIFALAGLMELPTFHLAISILHPKLRHNILFAATFFTTRIAFHVGLFISYFSKATRMKAVDGSFVPAGLFAAVFPLHVQWFTGCIKGFIRRSKARRKPALLAPQSIPEEPKLVQVIVQPEQLAPESPVKEITSTSTLDSSDASRDKPKSYPPSTRTLPSTPMPHSPPRIITMSISTRARSRSSSAASAMSRPSSPVMTYSPTQANSLSRRRSLVSAEQEESIRRLVNRVAGLADEAIAASPAVQSAVAVGRGMARTYNVYRGRAIDGARRRGISWRRFDAGATAGTIEVY